IFAFGIVLYELVTGNHPFAGNSSLEMLIASTRDLQQPASRVNPDVSPDLERIIDTCLAKDPNGRFASARDVVAALERIPSSHLSSPPPSASSHAAYAPTLVGEAPRSSRTITQAPPPPARRARLAALAGAVVIAALGLFAVSLRATHRPVTPPAS